MQIKKIAVWVILNPILNVSCISTGGTRDINVYHCRGVVDPGISAYYYYYRINGDEINVKKRIPDIYTHSFKDKLEFDVRGNSREFVSKLRELMNNVKKSEVDLHQRKEVMVNIPGKSFIYYPKSESAEYYIDEVVNVVLNMYKDKSNITVSRRS